MGTLPPGGGGPGTLLGPAAGRPAQRPHHGNGLRLLAAAGADHCAVFEMYDPQVRPYGTGGGDGHGHGPGARLCMGPQGHGHGPGARLCMGPQGRGGVARYGVVGAMCTAAGRAAGDGERRDEG